MEFQCELVEQVDFTRTVDRFSCSILCTIYYSWAWSSTRESQLGSGLGPPHPATRSKGWVDGACMLATTTGRQDRTGQDRTGQDRTGQGRAGELPGKSWASSGGGEEQRN
ncbi:hypothetical protein BO86DRAFT_220187 [Aspergillus japonicus CBS 114.51]|uniref:Uncharacterized protein n=1 Tax=Aspergillus japonicus CBS 114.51 TaxID=1448312 RepID=A0A8T8WP69_ASPJA|nr:hypothetical protein BO86DRAFT_220187 [Aspergillus japonicus CBS 114.51]RAH77440.1 hypothetical protein BO86DRAFT_220187 [Aspergillus japonicus CBS 114.51]